MHCSVSKKCGFPGPSYQNLNSIKRSEKSGKAAVYEIIMIIIIMITQNKAPKVNVLPLLQTGLELMFSIKLIYSFFNSCSLGGGGDFASGRNKAFGDLTDRSNALQKSYNGKIGAVSWPTSL